MLTSTTAVNLQITRSLVIGIPNPIQLLADKVTERRLFAATRQDAHATCRDEALRSACVIRTFVRHRRSGLREHSRDLPIGLSH
jgi:hypothetical protein